VQASGGFVDSYIGDAVMAVFDRGPEAAIDAAIAMSRALADWTSRAGTARGPAVRIGVGIATGRLVFGTIGAANRLKCGVIGDTVNLASRVEGLTKLYGLGLLVTGETLAGIADPARYQLREVDLVTVVGRQTPVRLIEILDAEPAPLRAQKAATAPGLAQGHALYREGRIAEARAAFEAALALCPQDSLLPRLIQRCHREEGREHGPDWSGVEHLVEK
jgi:class 3 adenylate cyclase